MYMYNKVYSTLPTTALILVLHYVHIVVTKVVKDDNQSLLDGPD